MTGWAEKPWVVAVILAVLVALTQGRSVFQEVLSWDETTFMVLASQLLDGQLPYVGSFDNKPPMIFFMFAAVMGLFGENLIAIRLSGDICILFNGLLTVAIASRMMQPLPALLSGAIYIVLLSIPQGQYTSTELPSTLLVLAATWVLMRGDFGPGWAFLAGALISLAVLTRTNLAFVAVAIGFVLAVRLLIGPGRDTAMSVLSYVAGGLVPLSAILLLYFSHGALDLFLLSTVSVPLHYASSQSTPLEALRGHAIIWRDHILIHEPLLFTVFTISILAGGAVFAARMARSVVDRDARMLRDGLLLTTILVATMMSLLGTGAVYPHYWLLPMPFAAVLAGLLLDACLRWRLRWLAGALVALIALPPLWGGWVDLTRLVRDPDREIEHPSRRAAEAIEPHLSAGDRIWATYYQIVPWYLDEPPITWVAAHPDNITRDEILKPLVEAGVVPPDILAQVMASLPAFIVTNSTLRLPEYLPRPEFDDYLARNYGRFFAEGDVTVHRRIGHDGWTPQ